MGNKARYAGDGSHVEPDWRVYAALGVVTGLLGWALILVFTWSSHLP